MSEAKGAVKLATLPEGCSVWGVPGRGLKGRALRAVVRSDGTPWIVFSEPDREVHPHSTVMSACRAAVKESVRRSQEEASS